MTAAEAADTLAQRLPQAGFSRTDFRGEISLTLDPSHLVEACRLCRDELGFDFLLDISSVDHLGEELRWEVVYELYSLTHKTHLRLKCRLPEEEPVIATLTGLWATADWHEREVYDMMGIRFDGHPDLRRILMWEGYPFYPLRKDFPLAGKSSEVHEVAFSEPAPLAGGPFVSPAAASQVGREPRAR